MDQDMRLLGRSGRGVWLLGRSSREGEAVPMLGLAFSAVWFASILAIEMVPVSGAADT